MGKKAEIVRGFIDVEGAKMDAKVCLECGDMKLLTEYTPNKAKADGRFNKCKKCTAEQKRLYAKSNPEVRRKAERNWREKNVDKVKEMASRSRKKHAEDYRERLRKWRSDNPEQNKEINERYRINNADKVKEAQKKWASENKDKLVTYAANRRARVSNLRDGFDEDWKEILLSLYGGCIVTGEAKDIHWDHFIPIATGKCGTYAGNMVPLSAKFNHKKGAKNPIDFLLGIGMSYEKLYDILFILAFLNDMNLNQYVEFVYECFDEKEAI